jgi:hypothetical protein
VAAEAEVLAARGERRHHRDRHAGDVGEHGKDRGADWHEGLRPTHREVHGGLLGVALQVVLVVRYQAHRLVAPHLGADDGDDPLGELPGDVAHL